MHPEDSDSGFLTRNGLSPVFSHAPCLLILGSFPSPANARFTFAEKTGNWVVLKEFLSLQAESQSKKRHENGVYRSSRNFRNMTW